jgi:TetR/AcrR family transcriptional regulator, ethionamide resistance regulator
VRTAQSAARQQRLHRRDETQTRIREAALDLLRTGASFKELTVDEIARRAGLKRSAFYFYFRDKEDLLASATRGVFERLYAEAERWWHGSGDPLERLPAALHGVTSVYAEHSELLRTVTEAAGYDRETSVYWRGLVQRFIEATADQLYADRDAGRLPDLEPGETAAHLVWMVERVCYVEIATGGRDADDVAAALARTCKALLHPEQSVASRGVARTSQP